MQLEKAEKDLRGLLSQMRLGESITLTDADEKPIALLVSLQAKPRKAGKWLTELEVLAKDVAQAWKDDTNAVEAIAEIRR